MRHLALRFGQQRLVATIVLLIAFAAFQVLAVNLLVVFFAACLAAFLSWYRRLGIQLASVSAFLIHSSVLLASGLISPLLPISYGQSAGIFLLVAGLLTTHLSKGAFVRNLKERSDWGTEHWAALIGPLVFTVAFAASKKLPGGNRYSWAMNNDAVNNILMVRDLVNDAGILVGEGGNPVPFTTSFLSLFMVGSDTDFGNRGTLHADVIGLQLFWLMTVVILGLSAGLVAAELVRRNTSVRAWAVAGASISSFATTMWFFSTYPVEFGFLNAPLGLALLLIGVFSFQFRDEHPILVFALLMLTATLVAATWTPTLVFLVGFVAFIAITKKTVLLQSGNTQMLIWLLPLAFFISFIALVSIPSLLRTGSLLSSNGGVQPLPVSLMWALPLVLMLSSCLAFGIRSMQTIVFSSVGLGQVLALAALLLLNRDLPDPWTYYPFKMLWFGSAFITLILVPLLLISISKIPSSRSAIALGAGLAVTLPLALNATSIRPGEFYRRDIVKFLFAPQAQHFNDTVATRIFSDDVGELTVYWASEWGEQARALNFWNISNWANSLKPDVFDIRYLAYNLPADSPGLLCSLADLANTEVHVVTSLIDLDKEVKLICPDASFDFSNN